MVKSRYIGDGHPTFNRNPYNGYINPYYWVDDHPLLYGNNGSLDPGTYTGVQLLVSRRVICFVNIFGTSWDRDWWCVMMSNWRAVGNDQLFPEYRGGLSKLVIFVEM